MAAPPSSDTLTSSKLMSDLATVPEMPADDSAPDQTAEGEPQPSVDLPPSRPPIVEDGFGFVDNLITGERKAIKRYTITNTDGLVVQVISRGAAVTSVMAPGLVQPADVVLGFDDVTGYTTNTHFYFGTIIGRVASWITDAHVDVDGDCYPLKWNVGGHCFHGGLVGFDQAIWDSAVDGDRVVFSHFSPNGDQGFPGDLLAHVAYSLNDDGSLVVEMRALSSAATPVSMASHVCFNLAGHSAGPIALREHVFCVNADKYMESNPDELTAGNMKTVGGSVFDLRIPRAIKTRLEDVAGGGYDHTFILNGGPDDGVRFAARVLHPPSGRVLEMFSDQPSLQLITGRNLPDPDPPPPMDDEEVNPNEVPRVVSEELVRPPDSTPEPLRGKMGAEYWKYGCFSVAMHNLPDAVHKPNFPNCILRPGHQYSHTVIYRFSTMLPDPQCVQ